MKTKLAIMLFIGLVSQSASAQVFDFLSKRKAWKCELEVSVIQITTDGLAVPHLPIAIANEDKIYFEKRYEAIHDVYWKLYQKTNDWKLCREDQAFENYSSSEKNKNKGYWFKTDEAKMHEMFFPKSRYPKVVEKIKKDRLYEAGEYHVCFYTCDSFMVDPEQQGITFVQ